MLMPVSIGGSSLVDEQALPTLDEILVPVPASSWQAVEQALGQAFAEALQDLYTAHLSPDPWARSQGIQQALPGLRIASSNLAVLESVPPGCQQIPGTPNQVCFGSTGDDHHDATGQTLGGEGDIFIDLGGDDVYDGRSGSFGDSGGIFIDLDGDDTYTVDSSQSVCRTLCDTNTPGEFDGAWGAKGGIFLDAAGDDIYSIKGESYRNYVLYLMGAAGGLFIELDGQDDYHIGTLGFHNGLGSFCIPCLKGTGLGADGGTFVEAAGDDTYYSVRTAFGAGGLALELAGDDRYSVDGYDANVFGVGGGGLGGNDGLLHGVFIDAAGNDIYDILLYSRDAFGAHGTFADLGGDDTYQQPYPTYSKSFGFGSSIAPGRFIDVGGEDVYPVKPKGEEYGLFADSEGSGPDNSWFVFNHETDEHDGEFHNDAMPLPIASPTTGAYATVRDSQEELVGVTGAWQPQVVALGSVTDYDISYYSSIPSRIHIDDRLGGSMFGPGAAPPGGLFSEGFHFTPGGTASGTATLNPAQEGPVDVELHVYPLAGSTHLRREILTTVEVDGTEPSIATTVHSDGWTLNSVDWYNLTDMHVHVAAHDDVAGMARLFVSVDPVDVQNDAPVLEVTPGADGYGAADTWHYNLSLAGLPDGEHTVHAVAIDAVGNEATTLISVRLDRTAPDWNITLENGTRGLGGWWLEPPTVWLSGDDALAGVASADVEWTGATLADLDVQRSFPANITAEFQDGISHLQFTLADAAYKPNPVNVSHVELWVDQVPPTTRVIVPEDLEVPVTLSFTAFDATSGVAKTQYAVIGDKILNGTGPEVTVNRAGDWTVRFRSQDHAGHWEAWSEEPITTTSPPPVAHFTLPASIVAMDPVSLVDASSDDGVIESWHWDFGDGQTSTDQNPQHAYARSGEYTIKLTVTDDAGQPASYQLLAQVQNNVPQADFHWTPATPIEDQTITFTDASQELDGSIVRHTWLISGDLYHGDVVQVALGAGVHDVRLEVEDDEGAVDVLTQVVRVVQRPPLEVQLSYSPAAPTTLDEVVFEATVSGNAADIVTWQWAGVDGSDATAKKTFDPGQHVIGITVEDQFGDTASAEVIVQVQGIAPLAAFAVSELMVLTGQDVTFTDGSLDQDGIIASWAWAFGDQQTSTSVDPVHQYADDGTYTVRLTVTDDHGLQSHVEQEIVVLNRGPTVSIQGASATSIGDDVVFQAIADDPDGTIASVLWQIGDTQLTGEQVTHQFQQSGLHTVQVTVVDDDGESAVAYHDVTVNQPPDADFSVPSPIQAGTPVTFTDTSLDADGTIVAWRWDLGGVESTLQHPTHTFDASGQVTVTLHITDDAGAQDTISKDINVVPAPLVISIDAPGAVIAGQNVTFTATTVADGQYTWSLGDGSSSELAAPIHAYAAAGTYTVSLEVTLNGRTGSDSIQVVVAPAAEESDDEEVVDDEVDDEVTEETTEPPLEADPAAKQDAPLPLVVLLGALCVAVLRQRRR